MGELNKMEKLIVNKKEYWENKYWILFYKIEADLKELKEIKQKLREEN